MLDALAAFGLRPEGSAPVAPELEPFFLLPENEGTFRLWLNVQTQWMRAGLAGTPTGLRYEAVLAVLRERGGSARRRRQRFEELQDMERAALDAWAELQPPKPAAPGVTTA